MFMMYIQEVHIVPKRTTSPVLEFLNNPWGARNRVEIGFSYRPAWWIGSLESILGPLKSLKIWALDFRPLSAFE
jgi:hypothetical protein